MLKRIALFSAVLVACVPALRSEEWHKSFTVGAQPDLRVDAKDGSITVKSWSEKSILARVTTTGWKIGSGELDIIDRQTGDHVELTLRLPSMSWGGTRRSIQVEISVPRETKLDLRTGDGAIRVNDVEGEMRLTSGDGSVTAESAVLGPVTARTGDGRISMRGRLTNLSLRTGDGSIMVEALPGSRPASSWRVETGDGSVTMRVPSDFAANVDLHTGDGSLTVDLPISTDQRDKRTVRGKLNGGGPVITVHTGDGSIKIGRI